jgi:hypothetical protein
MTSTLVSKQTLANCRLKCDFKVCLMLMEKFTDMKV